MWIAPSIAFATAAWEPAIQALVRAEAALPGARLFVVLAAGSLAYALLALEEPDRRGPITKLILLAAATRLLLPDALLHIQNDDLALVAVAAGAPLSQLPASHSADGLLLPLLRSAPALIGTGLDAATLLSRFFGVLLPPLGALLAWRHAGRRAALLVGGLLLLSPVAWPYSSAVTAYLPAAVGATVALWAGAAALDGRRPALLGPLATLSLALSAGLKPEFILLIPSVALALAWGRGRQAWFVGLGALAASVVLLLPGYADSFLVNGGGRLDRADPGFLARKLLEWGVIGWLLLTPPVLLTKLAFLRGARHRGGLATFVVAWSGLYLLSESSWGLNQWRHALIYLAPLLTVAAPVLLRWSARRGLVVLFVVLQVAAFGLYGAALTTPEHTALAELRSRPAEADTLVLYVRHGQDLDPRALLTAAEAGDLLALDDVAPPGCSEGAALRLVHVRTQAVDLARKHRPGPVELGTIDELTAGLAVLSTSPAADRAGALRAEAEQIKSSVDPDLCREQAESSRALLAPYRRVLLFVDPAPLDEDSWLETLAAEHLGDMVLPPAFHRWEQFELSSIWLGPAVTGRSPGLHELESVAMPSIGARLWSRPDR